MPLALVGIADAENEPGWRNGDIPFEHMIRGLQSMTLLLDSAQKTAAILTDVFGFQEVAREGSVIRFAAAADAKGSVVDIHETGGVLRGHQARGSVHHIAFRAASDVQQAEMAEKLIRTQRPTPDKTKGPKVLPLDLLPRTRRRCVRDRDRYSWICGRRAGRFLWSLPNVLEPRRKEIEGVLPVLKKAASRRDRLPLRADEKGRDCLRSRCVTGRRFPAGPEVT